MKKFNLALSPVVTALLLFGASLLSFFPGCAGFTEDPNTVDKGSDSDDRYAEAFASARVLQTGSFVVDESNGVLTVVLGAAEGSAEPDSMTYGYEFSGDTLFLRHEADEDGKPVKFARIFVGDAAGEIEGVWLESRCVAEDGELVCDDDAPAKLWKFAGGTVEIRIAEEWPDENGTVHEKLSVDSVDIDVEDEGGDMVIAFIDDGVRNSFDTGIPLRNGAAKISKSAKTITVTYGDAGLCFANGGTYRWEPDYHKDNETVVYDYDDSDEDTLAISYDVNEGGDEYRITRTLVGSSPQLVNGYWMESPCYSKRSKSGGSAESVCDELPYTTMWKIYGTTVETRQKRTEAFNYMNSEFVAQLLRNLTSTETIVPSLGLIFESRDLSGAEAEYGFSIGSRSSTNEVIKYNGNAYEISVDYANPTNDSVCVRIFLNDSVMCVGRSRQPVMNEGLCSAEFADALVVDSDVENYPSYPAEFGYPAYYREDGDSTFRECLGSIFGHSGD